MATKITDVAFTIRRRTGKRLDVFILDHLNDGGDHLSLAAAIGIASGQPISLDTRTAKSWIEQAKAATLI